MMRLALAAAALTTVAAYEACRHKLEFEIPEHERVTQSVPEPSLRIGIESSLTLHWRAQAAVAHVPRREGPPHRAQLGRRCGTAIPSALGSCGWMSCPVCSSSARGTLVCGVRAADRMAASTSDAVERHRGRGACGGASGAAAAEDAGNDGSGERRLCTGDRAAAAARPRRFRNPLPATAEPRRIISTF